MMHKIISLVFIMNIVVFGRSLQVVPADVNYLEESNVDFSEMLYDTVMNSIANYNFKQKRRVDMYHLKEGVLPSKQNIKTIKKLHKIIQKSHQEYMKNNKITKIILYDYNSLKVTSMLKKCKEKCNVAIDFFFYTYKKESKHLKKTYVYNAKTCLLDDKSGVGIDVMISEFLKK